MKIQLTSFINDMPGEERVEITKEIINISEADLLLFSGHTIENSFEIENLRLLIENNNTEVIFELESMDTERLNNCLYHIKDGKIQNLYTNQIFTDSEDIKDNRELADRLIHEFETRRRLNINGYSILIIQGEEINILNTIGLDNNIEFVLSKEKELSKRFKKIISETDIFLNPKHAPITDQVNIGKIREYLSKNKKYYFSSSNTEEFSYNLEINNLQYALFNKKDIIEIEKYSIEGGLEIYQAINRVYEI